MPPRLEEIVTRVQADQTLSAMDEASIKQSVILPLLAALGWNVFNVEEVQPEYTVGTQRVDYALRHGDNAKPFIEAKRPKEDLEKHQQQLLNYSFQEGVRLALLTNGLSWWFYLPLREGSWEQRKFYTIEIEDQDIDEIDERFESLLSRDRVLSGEAVKAAEELISSQRREHTIKSALPKAWEKLLSDPEDGLIELFAETTEKLCGFRPDASTVESFLAGQFGRAKWTSSSVPSEKPKREEANEGTPCSSGNETITGRKPSSFTLRGSRVEVSSWRDILYLLCVKFHKERGEQFESVFNLRGTKNPYFTRNKDELRSPCQIEGSDIFLEANLSANAIVKLSRNLIGLSGHDSGEFQYELQNAKEEEPEPPVTSP